VEDGGGLLRHLRHVHVRVPLRQQPDAVLQATGMSWWNSGVVVVFERSHKYMVGLYGAFCHNNLRKIIED